MVGDASTYIVRTNSLELYKAHALNLVMLVDSGFLALRLVHHLCA